MGVAVDTVERPFGGTPLFQASEFQFEPMNRAPIGAFRAADIESWRTVNRLWKSNPSVWRDPATGDFFPQSKPDLVEIKKPRIGLYRSYIPAMDEGWTRWLLENFAFDYRNVPNPEITLGNLRQRYDVIVFPDQPASTITEGFKTGSMPEQYVGGLGAAAAENLKRFASEGGTLVFLNHSSEYALDELGVKAKNSVRGVANRDFYSPGSLLNAALDRASPLSYGLPADIAIWSEGSPAWELPKGSPGHVAARYPKGNMLASGWLLGAKYLEGRAALVDYPMGKGRIILFGMRPQYRAQSYQNFKLFFNSLVLRPPL